MASLDADTPDRGLGAGRKPMFRTLLAVAPLAFIITAAAPAFAAPCKDARGKFAKCGLAGAIPIK